jgi:hypothetical protein
MRQPCNWYVGNDIQYPLEIKREKKHEFLHISSRNTTQVDVPLSGRENLMSNPNLIYNTTNGTHAHVV